MEKYLETNLISSGTDETYIIGKELGRSLNDNAVVALIGDLGAGKTILAKGIAEGLEVPDEPNSPTFVIMNVYEGRVPLYHFDLYRINNLNDLEDIGYKDFIYERGIKVIEWADKIIDVLPKDTVIIEISIIDENNMNKRNLKIKGVEKWVLSFKNTVERVLQT